MKVQLSAEIYMKTLDTMKKILDLGEALFDMRTKQFKFFKSQVMNNTYENLRKLFKYLEDNKILKKCPNKHNLRQGYRNCICKGSGYINFDTKEK